MRDLESSLQEFGEFLLVPVAPGLRRASRGSGARLLRGTGAQWWVRGLPDLREYEIALKGARRFERESGGVRSGAE